MSRLSSWTPRVLVASLAVLCLTSASWAQKPQTVRIRGTIEAVDGPVLSIKSRDGSDVKVRVADNASVAGIAKIEKSDIKTGAYIGVTGMPQPDGTQKAIAVHVFPEASRGSNEGFIAWDLRPNSTMTNATVDQKVESNDGDTIVVKYKDGEKKVLVTPDTPIVALLPGEKSELKAGANIIVFGATKNDDGTLMATRIGVGRDGITPPM